MKLPLTTFVCSVLSFFRVTPSQFDGGSLASALRVEALTNCFLSEACRREEFCPTCYMRKGPGDARSFAPQKSCDKLTVITPDSDHGWRDSVVRVEGSWEALAGEGANILEHWTGLTSYEPQIWPNPNYVRVGHVSDTTT